MTAIKATDLAQQCVANVAKHRKLHDHDKSASLQIIKLGLNSQIIFITLIYLKFQDYVKHVSRIHPWKR